MPKYRKLHTKTVESLDLNDMPDDFSRLLWVLLPLALCAEGRGLHNWAWVKSRIFPLREDVRQDDIATAFDWYTSRGMVVPYTVKGRAYFYVPTFHKYQGNTTKEADSLYPAPDSDGAEVGTSSRPTPEPVKSKSGTDAVCSIQYSDADTYADIRNEWIRLLPDKPRPREVSPTKQQKSKTRLKDAVFREKWRDALQRASTSTYLAGEGWFDLGWFLKNDDNWEKCYNGNYDDKQGGGNNSRPALKEKETWGT